MCGTKRRPCRDDAWTIVESQQLCYDSTIVHASSRHGRRVRVRGTGRNGWVALQALLELDDEVHGRPGVPRVAQRCLRILLFGIGDEVEGFRTPKLRRRRPPVPLLVV